jgi:hypothetical protein
MSATPKVGRKAKIYIAGVAVGYCQNVSGGASASAIKDHSR